MARGLVGRSELLIASSDAILLLLTVLQRGGLERPLALWRSVQTEVRIDGIQEDYPSSWAGGTLSEFGKSVPNQGPAVLGGPRNAVWEALLEINGKHSRRTDGQTERHLDKSMQVPEDRLEMEMAARGVIQSPFPKEEEPVSSYIHNWETTDDAEERITQAITQGQHGNVERLPQSERAQRAEGSPGRPPQLRWSLEDFSKDNTALVSATCLECCILADSASRISCWSTAVAVRSDGSWASEVDTCDGSWGSEVDTSDGSEVDTSDGSWGSEVGGSGYWGSAVGSSDGYWGTGYW
ncbi:hypothetical protein EYF80_018915 [Liparis tanakae]|uniref:Uncharacterized protein n=1 Tax=Liparis tanakae TaxID=230148 RepID=A0A4Z2HZF9_9TELE|nr:hypothetical protein EYF80_018915 [Liparis tanakae]